MPLLFCAVLAPASLLQTVSLALCLLLTRHLPGSGDDFSVRNAPQPRRAVAKHSTGQATEDQQTQEQGIVDQGVVGCDDGASPSAAGAWQSAQGAAEQGEQLPEKLQCDVACESGAKVNEGTPEDQVSVGDNAAERNAAGPHAVAHEEVIRKSVGDNEAAPDEAQTSATAHKEAAAEVINGAGGAAGEAGCSAGGGGDGVLDDFCLNPPLLLPSLRPPAEHYGASHSAWRPERSLPHDCHLSGEPEHTDAAPHAVHCVCRIVHPQAAASDAKARCCFLFRHC